MNNIDKSYQNLLQDILDNGLVKTDRTGTGTISVFGRQIRHKMKDGFPLLTTKKMAWKSIVTELLWFLRGDTNIKYLVDNGCHIWDGDAFRNYEKKAVVGNVIDSHYEPATDKWHLYNKEEFIDRIKTDNEFAKKWGELGSIYGKQWRKWKINLIDPNTMEFVPPIDQIANLISELKTNPDSRRLMVNAWNVGELDQMVLPPCHYGFQVYTRELSLEERLKLITKNNDFINDITNKEWIIDVKEVCEEYLNEKNIPTRAISLMYNTRSQDVPLGTPFNIASYALLLEIIAKEVNMVPDELIANMGDCHIYLNQKEGVVEQLTREPYPLPKLKILDRKVDDIAHYEIGDFIIEGYQSHPAIKMPLSN
jgi:thymidylate synthase